MSFRDDNDALRARIEQLEHELADARRSREAPAERREKSAAERWFGGPLAIERELELPGELDEEGIELAVERLRATYKTVGEVSRVGRTFAWSIQPQKGSGRNIEATIVTRKGRTRVRVVEKLGQLAGGLFGGIVGGAGGGGIVLPLMPVITSDMPWLALITVPAWLGGIWAVVRAGFGAAASARARTMDAMVRDLEEDLRDHLASQPAPAAAKVRVPADDADERDEEDEQSARTARRERA